jgi:thiol-disulfide isomerase/thioredoxin|tara:strand:- start:117 stop:692 length:576 start_codon:yes stop_codon:yes gene_type:complete
MNTMILLKLGPLLLIVNIFFSSLAVAESNYEDKTKDIIEGELRKFIFSDGTKTLPNPVVLDMDENVVEIGSNDDILVINFWATWCAPCKKEMPSLNNLAENMKYDDVRIITVASGRNSKEAIESFFSDNDLVNLNKFRDPRGKIAMSYGVTALPTTVVIDPSGKEIGRIIGDIDWNTENIRAFFRNLLKTS